MLFILKQNFSDLGKDAFLLFVVLKVSVARLAEKGNHIGFRQKELHV